MGFGREKNAKISFYFCVISEGFFPFKEKKNWPSKEGEEAKTFFPTFQSLLLPEEWKKFSFTEEEEAKLLKEKGAVFFPEEIESPSPLLLKWMTY